MADPVRNYIRRSRPELASYRTKKSFWENLTDDNESPASNKRPVSVPTFGEIKRKFDYNQRRSRSGSKSNDAEKAFAKTDGRPNEELTRPKSVTLPSTETRSGRNGGPVIKELTTAAKVSQSNCNDSEREFKKGPVSPTTKDVARRTRGSVQRTGILGDHEGEVQRTKTSSPSHLRDESPDAERSRRSTHHRSLEIQKPTFLMMTEVMEGYVPSDTDSVSSTKDIKVLDYRAPRNGASKLNESDRSTKTVETLNTNSHHSAIYGGSDKRQEVVSKEKTPSTSGSDGSVKKRTRVRRRGSGHESRFEAVKKEDIESAKQSITPTTSSPGSSASSPQRSDDSRGKSKTESSVTDKMSTSKLQRQDSDENPLKRKRDKRANKLKLTSHVVNSSNNRDVDCSDATSPKTPSYEAKSVLSGIKLSSPKTPSTVKEIQESVSWRSTDDSNSKKASVKTDVFPVTSKTHLLVSSGGRKTSREPLSPKKQYESIFMGRKRNFIYPVDDTNKQDSETSKTERESAVKRTVETSAVKMQPLDLDIPTDEFYSDMHKASDTIDSLSDSGKAFDTLDSNCSEHRWSTIDSGISDSVACALQQNAANGSFSGNGNPHRSTAQFIAQPALIPNEGPKNLRQTTRQRRYRRQSCSTDSDDDSGISWDELKDSRDVPLVIVEKCPDQAIQNDYLDHAVREDDSTFSSVKIEIDNTVDKLDKETNLLMTGIQTPKSSVPSAIGSRINQKWKFKQDDSDDEIESDEPLRTSTPTGTQVSVVLEPNVSSKSVIDSTTTENFSKISDEVNSSEVRVNVAETSEKVSDSSVIESKSTRVSAESRKASDFLKKVTSPSSGSKNRNIDVFLPKPKIQAPQRPKIKPDANTRPSRLSRFLKSSSPERIESEADSKSKSNADERKLYPGSVKDRLKKFESKDDTKTSTSKTSETVRTSKDDLETKPKHALPSITKPKTFTPTSSSTEKVRSKSETTEPTFFKVLSRSLTRQQSPLDPMDDVLTKRSPFKMPSSLSQNGSANSGIKRRLPGVSQYQKTHTHSRTSYNTPFGASLHKAKSTPILYEPRAKGMREEKSGQNSIKPVIRARESSLPHKGANITNRPPGFTPSPPQPTSLASRLLPQRRRYLGHLVDFESESSFHTSYTTDDEVHSDENTSARTVENRNGEIIPNGTTTFTSVQQSGKVSKSTLAVPSAGVFSQSDNEEQAPRKSLPPSLRLRQKVRSRTSSASSRPVDLSFSDSECVGEHDGTVVVRKRRRSRSRSRSEQIPEDNENEQVPGNNVNIHFTSTEAGDRKIDTLDSQKQSQARRQMSLSKTHKTSSKIVDRDCDLDSSFAEDQVAGSTNDSRGIKHMKDRNNNMISKQNKSLLSLEQLAEEEIISSASKLQIDLYKHKKHFEKDLSKKLENAMEESDNLVRAVRRGMNEHRTKNKVKEVLKNVNEVIKFDIIRDYRAKLQWYKVEINLGSYTKNLDARKISNHRVTVSCDMPDGPKFSKDIHLDFPESVDLLQLEILQVGDDLELRAPFKHWNPQTMDDVIENNGGNPKDTFTRIGFLEKAYRSMSLQWPPEGATAHYEYFSTRGVDGSPDQKFKKPPEYQSLIDSGQLKTCAV